MVTLVKRIAFPSFPAGRQGIALLFLRLMLGIGMMAHGYGKITDIGAFANAIEVPFILAAAAAISEFFGGLFLIIGLLTPFWSIMITGVMVEAIRTHVVDRGDPFVGGYELAAIYLVGMLVLLLQGPGRFSVDSMLFKR